MMRDNKHSTMKSGRSNPMVHIPAQKILVIDDDEDYRTMISATLNTIGYDTIEAINGLDGLTAVKIHHPDLASGIKMPKMDGHTLLGILKEDPECAAIPFIFLTGCGKERYAARNAAWCRRLSHKTIYL